tara:strand:+ start:390 stop:1010 length:621 start_codon:yes stop_codon:yes gene_type:complete
VTYTTDDQVLYSLRFAPPQLFGHYNGNFQVFGLFELLIELKKSGIQNCRMLEIGSHMGESTALFAMSKLFTEIHCIEPFSGEEEFNDDNLCDWGFVENQFLLNTRHHTNIIHHKHFSQDIHEKFEDDFFDFIYIDADHSYESVKSDLINYIPKIKDNGFVGGHDYKYPQSPERQPPFAGCVKAIDEVVGIPTKMFEDSSWIKRIQK